MALLSPVSPQELVTPSVPLTAQGAEGQALLVVDRLSVVFPTPEGRVVAVAEVSFTLAKNEILAVVGESGSGKSQMFFALMGLLPANAEISGSIRLNGKEILGLQSYAMDKVRAEKVSMIFQDPMTALNPYCTIGSQLMEVLQVHKGFSREGAFSESVRLLEAVHMSNARRRMSMYPHEFSGGMRQRVVIAMALLCRPQLLIADEPTTALDVTIQAQILKILQELQSEFKMSIVLITHDLGIVASLARKALVMYAGRVMELGSIEEIFYRPRHPYTQGLLSAVPSLEKPKGMMDTIPGNPPNLIALPPGCPFQARCKWAEARCRSLTFSAPTEGMHHTACPYHDFE